MFSEFKSNEAFFYGLCDATFSEVWCLGSLGVIPRYLSFILFYFTVHVTVHSTGTATQTLTILLSFIPKPYQSLSPLETLLSILFSSLFPTKT